MRLASLAFAWNWLTLVIIIAAKIAIMAITTIISTIVNYGTFFGLLKLFLLNYLISSAAGFCSGVVIGYFLNTRWTFNKKKDSLFQIIKYCAVYATSLILGLMLLKVLVDYFIINALIANFFVICFTTCLNFVGLKIALKYA